MIRLSCSFQTYDWGKLGPESEVFRILTGCTNEPNLKPDLPYAELWMGTHSSGPSYIYEDKGKLLSGYIVENPTSVGISIKKFGRTLPFLFKVLSIRKALSIQAHPNKKHAEELHRQRPDLYKDANHKPEIAIALTPFEALLAFRPPSEIASFVLGIPELLAVIGSDRAADLSAVAATSEGDDNQCVAIKAAYEQLMRADQKLLSDNVNQLNERLVGGCRLNVTLPESSTVDLNELKKVFIRLSNEYPGDCGCFSLFFLNYVKLQPGQAVFLEANLPHAYISGDCIECMACSDNVVRAGLTPKYKDVECLLSMLQYEPRTASSSIFPPKQRPIQILPETCESQPDLNKTKLPSVMSYAPPVEEFAVDRIWVPPNCEPFHLFALPSASILIIISGSGKFQLMQCHQPVDGNQPEDKSNSETDKPEATSRCEESSLSSYAGCLNPMIDFHPGMVFFVHAGASYCLHLSTSSVQDREPVLAFRAYANVDYTPEHHS